MADRRGLVVPFLIFAFLFLSSEPTRQSARQFHTGRTFDDVIAEEQRSLSALHNSSYSDGIVSLNVTGLENERGFAWDALAQVQARVKAQLQYALGDTSAQALDLQDEGEDAVPLYKNITGFVHGDWIRSNLIEELPAPRVNVSQYATFGPFGRLAMPQFGRNITAEQGDLRVRFHERRALTSASLNESTLGNVTSLDAELTLNDGSSDHILRMLGVYFPTAGQALLTTTSEKLAGIFALPHMALSERMFEASRALLNDSISRTIQRQIDRDTEKFNPWSSTAEGATDAPITTPKCELVMYLQQLPPVSQTTQTTMRSTLLAFVEREMRFPTGAFVPPAPEMRFSMVIFSPDCGYMLESKGPPDFAQQESDHLIGQKMEVMNINTRTHALFFTAILALQLILLKRQMHEASTPSTRSRISLYTVAMLSLGDGFTFMTFLLVSFFTGGLFTTIMTTAFISFISVSFFGMRFLLDVWTVQAPERAARRREEDEEDQRRDEMMQATLTRLRAVREERLRQATNSAGPPAGNDSTGADPPSNPPAPAPTDATSDPPAPAQNSPGTDDAAPSDAPQPPATEQPPANSLPLPVTAQRPTDTGATPVFMPSDQQGLQPITQGGAFGQRDPPLFAQESFGALYTRFYLLLLGVLFMSLNAAAWPSPLRRIYFTVLGFVYLSYWLPQINRNVQRNCRKALSWEFVIGQSVFRFSPFVYFYAYSGNVIFTDTDYVSLTILGTWLWVQIVVLVSQEIIGPRWFVGKDSVPPAYDYHPVLREDEEGATMPIGFSQVATSSEPGSPVVGRERSDSARRDSISAKETKEKGKRVFDCAICMQDLEVTVVEGGSSDNTMTGPAGLLARRLYMVTPCRHIFHSACLEGWMKYRLQCPICRETLPPL